MSDQEPRSLPDPSELIPIPDEAFEYEDGRPFGDPPKPKWYSLHRWRRRSQRESKRAGGTVTQR